ncbi:MAG: RNA polymerase sigma-70 factor [Prolixibacteraceae bacterium]|nr:RNA polymerase sigma-70 factor [Prolixibacteraceae bacterium]
MEVTGSILTEAIKKGDYIAFNQLFSKYYAHLCAYVFKITDDYSTAEDIVQELFVKIWVTRSNLEISTNLNNYLFVSARNHAFNYLRQENNRRKLLEKVHLFSNESSQEIAPPEFIDALEKCIDKLPSRTKQVLLMNKFKTMKLNEISLELQTSVKTIKNQLWKAIKMLRECLTDSEVTQIV